MLCHVPVLQGCQILPQIRYHYVHRTMPYQIGYFLIHQHQFRENFPYLNMLFIVPPTLVVKHADQWKAVNNRNN